MTDETIKDLLKKVNNKINSLPTPKKVLMLILLLTTFFSIWYLAHITGNYTKDYKELGPDGRTFETLCTEEYKKWKLITEPCPQNEVYFPKERKNPWENLDNYQQWISNKSLN